MSEKTVGFRVYKCLHGWCFVRDDVDIIYTPVRNIRAYSSLSQALWHLDKRAKEIDADDVRRAGGGTGTVARGKEARAQTQPPASRASASESVATSAEPSALSDGTTKEAASASSRVLAG